MIKKQVRLSFVCFNFNLTQYCHKHATLLLFISYTFVKGFLAITFLLLDFFKLKLSWCVSTFFILKIISVGSIDMTLQKWAIFIMGVYGENICLLSDEAEIFVYGYIENVDTHHESFG